MELEGNMQDLKRSANVFVNSFIQVILPFMILLYAKRTNNANERYYFINGIMSPKVNCAKDLCCPLTHMCF